MIQSRNIKCIVCDFDQTLCIHNPGAESTGLIGDNWYIYLLSQNENPYIKDGHYAPPEMIKFLKEAKECNDKVKFCVCSKMGIALHMSLKEDFVRKKYPDIDWFNFCAVGNDAGKIRYLTIMKELFKCLPAEVILIDDNEEILSLAQEKGYQTINPAAITNGLARACWYVSKGEWYT